MYVLYIGNKNYSSWSLRPWVLMRMLDVPFEERLVPFADGSSHATFRSFSPTGRVPCLVDQDQVVWDSLGITEFLAERHAWVWPQAAAARTWARCAAAEMHAGFATLREVCGMSCGLRIQLHTVSEALSGEIGRLAELWNEGLARFGGPFLAGAHFTAVDAFFAPVAFRIQTYALPLDAACTDYVARLLALPPMQQWYSDALAETWREPGHEAELRRAGTWLADLRATA